MYLPHFPSCKRQRRSGIGALTSGIGRVAFLFAKKFHSPAAKNIEEELLVKSVPQVLHVITKRKSPRKASKKVISKTIKKQIGSRSKHPRRSKKCKTTTKSKRKQRSRSHFFSKVKNVAQRFTSGSITQLIGHMWTITSFHYFWIFLWTINWFDSFTQWADALIWSCWWSKHLFRIAKTFLQIKCKLSQNDVSDLGYDAANAAQSDTPVFVNTLHSLFSVCTITVNGMKVSNLNVVYAPKAFIETEYSNGKEAKETWVSCQG